MTPLIRSPVIKRVQLEGDLYQLVSITATAKLVSFNEQLNFILTNFFFGDTTMSSKNNSRNNNMSGFTLIELLLVTAIIGILTAIALPVFINQRATTRDRASVSNMVNKLDDVMVNVSQELQAGVTSTAIATNVTALLNADKSVNPWSNSSPAYSGISVVQQAVNDTDPVVSTAGAMVTMLSAATTAAANVATGQVSYYYSLPVPAATNLNGLTAAALPGFIAGAVNTKNSGIQTKIVAFEQ
jgi:prepilin-type N-terminal cleavage/methylation domain-containing protein